MEIPSQTRNRLLLQTHFETLVFKSSYFTRRLTPATALVGREILNSHSPFVRRGTRKIRNNYIQRYPSRTALSSFQDKPDYIRNESGATYTVERVRGTIASQELLQAFFIRHLKPIIDKIPFICHAK